MYDIADIITLIQTTGYTVERAKAKEPVLSELTDLPIVYVGFRGIGAENPTTLEGVGAYNQNGENLTQSFEVQICCEEQELPVIWRAVFKSLVGKNTQPLEQEMSSITYGKGGVIGFENGRLWHLDRWYVDFPSMNVFNF